MLETMVIFEMRIHLPTHPEFTYLYFEELYYRFEIEEHTKLEAENVLCEHLQHIRYIGSNYQEFVPVIEFCNRVGNKPLLKMMGIRCLE